MSTLRKYPLDVIKSSIHKYLRRNNEDMFMRTMLEFYIICKQLKTFKSLITHIQIMCAEEILFINCNKVILIEEKLNNFKKDVFYSFGAPYLN